MNHLFSNQFNWLLLYCKQPRPDRIRRLYLSRSEVINFLNERGEFIKEKKGILIYKCNDVEVLVYKDRLTIGKMEVLLTKPDTAVESSSQNQ